MQNKAFERKEELISAALDEFTTKNYEAASLNQIIKNAGISKGTFYYHFQDKKHLYLSLLAHGVRLKWEFINRAMEEMDASSEQDIFENFKLQARLGAQFAQKYPEYHQLSKMFSKEKGNEIYQIALDHLGASGDDALEAMIDSAIEEGSFREGFSREFILRIIKHLFASFDEIFGEDRFELEQTLKNLDAYVDFMKYGLGRD